MYLDFVYTYVFVLYSHHCVGYLESLLWSTYNAVLTCWVESNMSLINFKMEHPVRWYIHDRGSTYFGGQILEHKKLWPTKPWAVMLYTVGVVLFYIEHFSGKLNKPK